AKIQYAHDRWGATLFYVDSNGEPARPMDAAIFERLSTRFPGVLIAPEHGSTRYYASTALYRELRAGRTSTSALARAIYPEAFSLINIADGQPEAHADALSRAARAGDILLSRAWFSDPANQVVRQIASSPKSR